MELLSLYKNIKHLRRKLDGTLKRFLTSINVFFGYQFACSSPHLWSWTGQWTCRWAGGNEEFPLQGCWTSPDMEGEACWGGSGVQSGYVLDVSLGRCFVFQPCSTRRRTESQPGNVGEVIWLNWPGNFWILLRVLEEGGGSLNPDKMKVKG